MTMHLSSRRWQDQLMVLIGVWVFLSPWVYEYPADSAPALNAYIAGAIIAPLAAFDLYKTYVWAVLLNIVVGAWVAVSPWLVDTARSGNDLEPAGRGDCDHRVGLVGTAQRSRAAQPVGQFAGCGMTGELRICRVGRAR